MRQNADAPVDLMGCHTCADKNADPKTFRFQTLVALMLSSQTKDQVTSAAMERLKTAGCSISSLLELPKEQLEELLKPVGFYKRKTEYLKRVCAILREKYNDDIPNTFEGVGPKMANLTIQIAFGRIGEGIGVDTHVHRISNRLNWVKTKTPEQTEFELREVLPKNEWSTINQLLVGFGQTICLPVGPKCLECLLYKHGQYIFPMSEIEDDIFGLKKLDSLPLPNSHFNKQQNINRNTTKIKENGNLFDQHFFPELIKNSSKQNKQQCGQEGEVDFFTEHFERQTSGQEELSTKDVFELINQQNTGIRELWSYVDPVWKFSDEELVEFMAQRIVYETDEVIAFDKPFQVAYSGAPKDQAQLDRILQQQELRTLFDQQHFYFRFRCLCKNFPAQVPDKTRVSIPLIKVIKNGNVKFCPLLGRASSDDHIFHLNTDCKLIDFNKGAQVSLIDAFTRTGLINVVRSHLYYGLDCPLIGDQKYTRPNNPKNQALNPIKTALNKQAMEALNLRKNDSRKLPMFMHLGEVHLPEIIKGMEGKNEENCFEEGGGRGSIVFRAVPMRTLLFFKNYLEQIEYKSRERWIGKIYERVVDDKDNLILQFLHKVLELESEMWRLSTLGGAVSAMGFFSEKFVKAALLVSLRQLKIAQILGDPISIARCYLYISLGLAQDGHFKKAITTVRGIWKENIVSLHSEFLKNCTLGVWMTIKWIKTREKRTFLS
uniref:DNA-(apurinic or apyrimidinic site) lyase n=1 Tax=Meloidogyne javanica TaxID=6303 RepID=A0A915N0R9_MELJA